MKHKIGFVLLSIVIVLGLLAPASARTAEAQTVSPPERARLPQPPEPCRPGQPCQDENGEWFVREDPAASTPLASAPQAIGDSDDYGYTLSSAAYSWTSINATGISLGFDSRYDISGAIALPFTFPFYDNSYTQLYITGSGYLTFNDGYVESSGKIPDSAAPNNIIAPYWRYHYYNRTTTSSQVYYQSYGDRFVVQWHWLQDLDNQQYTFQAILYPNGNIEFRYRFVQDPSIGSWWCSTAGIENFTGQDGLTFWNTCSRPTAPSTAVLFTRPGPTARVKVDNLYQGMFTSPGAVKDFFITVTNTGDLGADDYALSLSSAWSASLLDPVTETPLTSTGSLAQGASRQILVRVTAPSSAALGDMNDALVTVTSTLNPARSKTVRLETTIPAAFGYTSSDQNDILFQKLYWPAAQLTAPVSNLQAYYGGAVAELPGYKFINIWEEYGSDGTFLNYSLVNHLGEKLLGDTALSSTYGEPNTWTEDSSQSIAAAPNGKIGVLWQRNIYDYETSIVNSNIWFAILGADGNISFGPLNLTNYLMGAVGASVSSPGIAVSSDNHFMLTWYAYTYTSGTYLIYYAIYAEDGSVSVPVTELSDYPAGIDGADFPKLTALPRNRFLLNYTGHDNIDEFGYWVRPYFRVYDSSGALLVADTPFDSWSDDSVQLSGGNILFVETWGDYVHYVLLDGQTFETITQSNLAHASMSGYVQGLSVTRDSANHGIITWTTDKYDTLYYFLLNGETGLPIGEPRIFATESEGIYMFGVVSNGEASTTNSWPLETRLYLPCVVR